MSNSGAKSYASILKSSSLIGGAQGINLLIGMVRVKFSAVLIGPTGVGLVGTYQSIQSMVSIIAGVGLQSSGVRDIAEAAGSEDEVRVGRTVLVLRRMCLLTGVLGALAMVALAIPLSRATFESPDQALGIAALGIVVLFGNIQGGQMAVIQGLRRIGDLARLNVLGTTFGSVVSIGLYARFGQAGIVPALLAMAAFNLLTSWFFARRIKIPDATFTWRETFRACRGMVLLGLALMWNGVMLSIVAYLTRVFINRAIGLAGAGIFSAAFNLSGMFINFILSAMGADYFPRLTAVSSNHKALNQIVNEQTEIGLLLGLPGLLATLSLAPWAIRIFYTKEFIPSADLLQWFVLGCLCQVVSWPMGYIMLAKAKSLYFVATETAFNALHLVMVWFGIKKFGIEGVAVAFFVASLLHTTGIFFVSRRLTGFSWAPSTIRLLLISIPVAAVVFVSARFLPLWQSTVLGIVATLLVGLHNVRGLVARLGPEHRLCRLLARVPLSRYVIPL